MIKKICYAVLGVTMAFFAASSGDQSDTCEIEVAE